MKQSVIEGREYDYRELKKIARGITEKYKNATLINIGKSVAGRDIYSIKIGRADEYVLYAGAFHGSERITSLLLMKFAEELCYALKNNEKIADIDAKRALMGKGILIVPMVNPDGCEISLKGELGCGPYAPRIKRLSNGNFTKWNANIRGVDINHNFDAGWEELHRLERENGYYGPGPTRYGGPHPESEPETVALVSLCKKVPIRHSIAFHSQGEVIYWKYNNLYIEKAREMAEILSASSGYALDFPTGLANGGGFKDWFMENFQRPAFTVEVGKGENPLNPNILNSLYSSLKEMMMLGIIM